MPNALRWRPSDWQVFILSLLFGLLLTVRLASAQAVAMPTAFADSLAAHYSHQVPTGYCLTTRASHDTLYVVGVAPAPEYRTLVRGGVTEAVAFSCATHAAYLVVHPDSGAAAGDSLTRAERMVATITEAPFVIVQYGDRLYTVHRRTSEAVELPKAST